MLQVALTDLIQADSATWDGLRALNSAIPSLACVLGRIGMHVRRLICVAVLSPWQLSRVWLHLLAALSEGCTCHATTLRLRNAWPLLRQVRAGVASPGIPQRSSASSHALQCSAGVVGGATSEQAS